MTRVQGTAIDPGTGQPLPKRLVYASLLPPESITPTAPDLVDEILTDANGKWELNLSPTVGTNSYYRIRIWQLGTFWVDVPQPPNGNLPVFLDQIVVPPPPPTAPAPLPGPYLMRSELEQPNGIATLGSDALLKLHQRPPGSGGPGGEPQEWFSGDGPPPSAIPGASVGDIYIDRLTGNLYQLT